MRTNISSKRSCYSFFGWNALHCHLLGHDSNIFLSLHKLPDSSKIISGSSWKCLKCRHAGFFFKGFVLASPSTALFSLCGWPTIPKRVLLIEAFINGEAPPSQVFPAQWDQPAHKWHWGFSVLRAQGLFIDVLLVLSHSCGVELHIIQPVPSRPGTLLSQDHRAITASWVGSRSNDLGPLTPAKPKQEVRQHFRIRVHYNLSLPPPFFSLPTCWYTLGNSGRGQIQKQRGPWGSRLYH